MANTGDQRTRHPYTTTTTGGGGGGVVTGSQTGAVSGGGGGGGVASTGSTQQPTNQSATNPCPVPGCNYALSELLAERSRWRTGQRLNMQLSNVQLKRVSYAIVDTADLVSNLESRSVKDLLSTDGTANDDGTQVTSFPECLDSVWENRRKCSIRFLMTPKVIKLDFKFPEQPGVTFSNNHEIPIVHSTINPFTSGYTFPSTSGQTQSEFVRPGMEPVFRKSFNMKWADKFIHQTDAEDAGKLLLLREKLDPFSLGLIAGIDGPQYHQAYNILTRYYSASFPLQQKLKSKVEALPRAEHWHQTDIMRSNLAVIKDVYNTLATSGIPNSVLSGFNSHQTPARLTGR
ncbi:hypothetical protein HUG17_7880 [Dermatophagoides farinae]|uniref:Uncharacterized protein n=1 Tax=Dermatophagoides farinae TaxID=6954 RepID=A0A9D4NY50_DERFA|nr:hypothetical protein HUG17_7880 [Dermatophagoides farinae]